jgi:hypothetical protein
MVICILPFLILFMFKDKVMCSESLEVSVAEMYPGGPRFESPLEQLLLKTRAVNSILGNRNMIGKIPTWWENSVRGNRKTAGKNSAMVGNFPQWEKKSLPLHGSFSTAAPVLYAGIYLPLFSQFHGNFTAKNRKRKGQQQLGRLICWLKCNLGI